MTRAKELTFGFTEMGVESGFIKEMKESPLKRGNFVTASCTSAPLIGSGCSAVLEAFFMYCPICGRHAKWRRLNWEKRKSRPLS